MNRRASILLVGGGNMGQALLRGWLADGRAPESIYAVDPNEGARAAVQSLGISASSKREMLSRGIVDATLIPYEASFGLKVHDLVDYHILLEHYGRLYAAGNLQ